MCAALHARPESYLSAGTNPGIRFRGNDIPFFLPFSLSLSLSLPPVFRSRSMINDPCPGDRPGLSPSPATRKYRLPDCRLVPSGCCARGNRWPLTNIHPNMHASGQTLAINSNRAPRECAVSVHYQPAALAGEYVYVTARARFPGACLLPPGPGNPFALSPAVAICPVAIRLNSPSTAATAASLQIASREAASRTRPISRIFHG